MGGKEMKKWCTEILAIDIKDNQLKRWGGIEVEGITQKDAQQFCENNGLGYCRVIGELIAEISCKKGTYIPDFENMEDYEQPTMN
jgi:hypothetical protein